MEYLNEIIDVRLTVSIILSWLAGVAIMHVILKAKWIKVEHEMPAEWKEISVKIASGYVYKNAFYNNDEFCYYLNDSMLCIRNKVTHWKPR
jgi:hypothetical protein